MRALGVVVSPPTLDDDLRLGERVGDFPIKQFIPEPGVEAFDEAVLPGRSRCDVDGLGPDQWMVRMSRIP